MDMIGVGGTDYSSYVNSSNADGIKNKINSASGKNATDEEMMAACKEFEAYMVEQVYKQMEKTIIKAEKKNEYEEYFSDYRIQAYAKAVSEQGRLGLAEQLYEGMKRNSGAVEDDQGRLHRENNI